MTYPPGPPSHPPTPYGAIPPRSDSRRALSLVLGAIVLVLALILAAGIVFVVKARDGDIYVPGLTLTAADEPGIDPFTDPVLVAGAGDLPENVALTGTAGAADLGGRAVNGTDAGLYGSGDAAACDTAALSNRLLADPPAARAWASVYGIGTADIPHYLNTLTPVVLTTDTWVTNHSYTSGRAVPFQSVLQRGTSVYVDSAGVPRALCACGNPLAPPAAAPLGGYRLEGKTWEGYKTRSVTRIAYRDQNVTAVGKSTTIVPAPPGPTAGTPAGDVLRLLNFLTGQLFSQPPGGLLDLSGYPPPSGPLPTPAALNTPFEADTEEDAEHNGLIAPGNPAAAPALEKRAEEHGGLPEGAPSSDSADPDPAGPDSAGPDSPGSGTPGPDSDAPAPDPSAPPSVVPAPEAPGSEVPGPASDPGAAGAPGPGLPAEAPATPTSFSGSGEVVGGFSFDDAGLSVGCTVPGTPATGTVALSCTDGVIRSVAGSALQRTSVSGSTSSTGVWTLTLTAAGASTTVAVRAANWIVIPPAAPAPEPPAPGPPAAEAPDVSTHAVPPAVEAPDETTDDPPASESPAAPGAPAGTP